MEHKTEILILGGGVVGCAIARDLSLAGKQCVILERGEPCREASYAAAGALIARALSSDEGPLLSLKIKSLAMFKAYCEALADDTGIDVGYRETGGIDFMVDEEEIASIDDFLEWQAMLGIQARRLSESELRQLEPNLSTRIQHGVLFPTFAQVRTPWFTRAILASALKHGARIECHTEARDFIVESNRVVGVRTDHDVWRADQVILAAGPWSPYLASLLGKQLPVVPVKGQILLLSDSAKPVKTMVHHGKTYITPRDDGRMVVGSTEEWVGFQKSNTVGGVGHLLNRVLEFYPCLASARLEQTWHGFRPLSADGLPIIGAYSGLDGLLCAAGHFRSGIILAPITGRIVAGIVTGKQPCIDLAPFSPDRLNQTDAADLTPRTDFH